MVKYHSQEIGYPLHIDSGYYSILDIEGFFRMMKDPPYCYKFYWLEAIVRLISEDKKDEACYRDNLHSIWASQKLYRKGNSKEEFCGILERNMRPVDDSARRQGYEVWGIE